MSFILFYYIEDKWKYVCMSSDDEHEWEMTKSHSRRLPRWGNAGNNACGLGY